MNEITTSFEKLAKEFANMGTKLERWKGGE